MPFTTAHGEDHIRRPDCLVHLTADAAHLFDDLRPDAVIGAAGQRREDPPPEAPTSSTITIVPPTTTSTTTLTSTTTAVPGVTTP